jgi:ABC-type branched-subunit amino acid transport system substrate-binding protein
VGIVGGRRLGVAVVAMTLAGAAVVGAVVGAPAARAQVRGFDGSTVTVAGFGIKAQLPLTEAGARARIKRFNDSNELKGIKIDYREFADDKFDPATALSEARRIVTQDGVFAIVGDASATNPGEYLTQQKVPFFGGGFDDTYCSKQPSTKVWGFSVTGCVTPSDPSFVSDNAAAPYRYVSTKTGKKHPSMAIAASDNTSGENQDHILGIAAQGTGFRVVSATHDIPETTSDFTPYVQRILKSDGGKPSDSVFCVAGTACIGLYQLLTQSGYEGTFVSGLYSDVLVKVMQGAGISIDIQNPADNSPGYVKMKADLDAYQPGTSAKIDLGAIYGYASADMFIQALKTAAAKGKANITPEGVQRAASTMTWELQGVKGKIAYPKATVMDYPACSIVFISDGAQWKTQTAYTCSSKTYSPSLKVGG